VIGLSLFPKPPASITPFTLEYSPINQLKGMLEPFLHLRNEILTQELEP